MVTSILHSPRKYSSSCASSKRKHADCGGGGAGSRGPVRNGCHGWRMVQAAHPESANSESEDECAACRFLVSSTRPVKGPESWMASRGTEQKRSLSSLLSSLFWL